jgi:hypothetical protein
MRKELLVFVSTTEHDNEISVTSVTKNRAYVLFNTGMGKFTANREDLMLALKAIGDFDTENNSIESVDIVVDLSADVEYGGQ